MGPPSVRSSTPRSRTLPGAGGMLDDQGALRTHMMVFVDGEQVADREGLSDVVKGDSEICVMQAL